MADRAVAGLTLQALADAKKLPVDELRSYRLSDYKYSDAPAVKIPYVDALGNIVAVRFRRSLAVYLWCEPDAVRGPEASLIAFQAYLQACAPWEVVVPFADLLADVIARQASAPRILRDFSRLLALIKSAAVLRHRRRRAAPASELVRVFRI